MAGQKRILGFIGGSGVYSVEALEKSERLEIETPWGAPSDALMRGTMGGVEVVFLSRHGAGHRLPPADVNYRANIDAMKRAGVTDLVSLSACGSFREDLIPGTFVIVDQLIDKTTAREKSFFGPGFVAHVSMADPICPALGDALEASCSALGIKHQRGGTYIAIDGPQFSSRAESHLYRSWGCDVIGMTNMPEAKLAREAELPYASVAMVTDYDCWRENEGAVEVGLILETLRANTANAARLAADVAARLGSTRTPSPLGIETVLDMAIITAPEARDAEMVRKLDVIAGRLLKR
ncbi:S-methyl-5'-thioadenosine phosphorylase [Hyphococcus sp.]|uniref:S-methyl-5'-thioadenosine phosphorylase n=1 Tax=Hyphococcus sp. TaxID=2038636 RepID=UPI002080D356|nr:MAG: S-methyl-5'-thioadenosine phosphorylase [Marinicaulis sp.]